MNIYKHLDTKIVSSLQEISINEEELLNYFQLIENNLKSPPENTKLIEKHHILPKSLFPEFSNLNKNKWNEVILTSWDHFEAHRLLMNITNNFKMIEAYSIMSQCGRWNDYINLDQQKDYEMARLKHKENIQGFFIYKDNNENIFKIKSDDPKIITGEYVHITKNKTTAKDNKGNTFQIDTNDPRLKSGELVGVTKNYVPVRDEITGNCFLISKEDFIKKDFKHTLKGKTTVKDKEGNTYSIDVNDSRLKSGELVGITKGKFVAIDDKGNTFLISKNDQRYISGELTSINSKKIMVKNEKGDTLSVNLDDPRYISGELKPINLNKIIVKDENGKNIQIDKNDPNYISGKYQHVNKNKIMARDLNGNTLQVDKDDPRFKTGEISGITKGMKKYTNGIINKTFFPGTEPEGFYLGSLRKKKK